MNHTGKCNIYYKIGGDVLEIYMESPENNSIARDEERELRDARFIEMYGFDMETLNFILNSWGVLFLKN